MFGEWPLARLRSALRIPRRADDQRERYTLEHTQVSFITQRPEASNTTPVSARFDPAERPFLLARLAFMLPFHVLRVWQMSVQTQMSAELNVEAVEAWRLSKGQVRVKHGRSIPARLESFEPTQRELSNICGNLYYISEVSFLAVFWDALSVQRKASIARFCTKLQFEIQKYHIFKANKITCAKKVLAKERAWSREPKRHGWADFFFLEHDNTD